MEAQSLDLFQIMLEAGIVVKLVLLLLVLASVVSWAIVFKKKKELSEMRANNESFINVYRSASSLREVNEACENLFDSPYKNMFTNGYKELAKLKEVFGGDREKLADHFKHFGLDSLERGLRKGVTQTDKSLKDLLSTLASIGSISPFIGLFGTVWGIIDSFKGIAGGGATLDAVAPGIAEALVATAIGLAAAIPAVWYFNSFNNENKKIHSDMDSFGQEFLNVVERTVIHK